MKYFGICAENFNDFKDIPDFEKFLIENNILEFCYTGQVTNYNDGILDFTVSPFPNYDYKEEFIDEFYNYIVENTFHLHIKSEKFSFFEVFSEEIYGLDPKEQKSIGLKHFKKIYNEHYLNVITFFKETVSDNGISHTTPDNKLKMLYGQYKAFKRNSSIIPKLIIYFLVGDKETLNSNLLENKIVKEGVAFEIGKQIMVELNDRFKFEDDYYFSNKFQDDLNYKKYGTIFKTLEAYQFTNTKIKNFTNDRKAYSVSLYQTLIDRDLIKSNKEEFKRFMNSEYDFAPAELVTYEKDSNRTHDERVANFSIEWDNFIKKNS